MRRNRSMGRGGARGSLSLNMSGGPLLTEHLKVIVLLYIRYIKLYAT